VQAMEPGRQLINWLECRAYFAGSSCLKGLARGGVR
jgi:hypothetical protein